MGGGGGRIVFSALQFRVRCYEVFLYFELFLCSPILAALLRGFAVLRAVFMFYNFGCTVAGFRFTLSCFYAL